MCACTKHKRPALFLPTTCSTEPDTPLDLHVARVFFTFFAFFTTYHIHGNSSTARELHLQLTESIHPVAATPGGGYSDEAGCCRESACSPMSSAKEALV